MQLETYNIPTDLQQKITAEQAFHYRIVPIMDTDGGIILKTDSDALKELLAELKIVLDTPVVLEKCDKEELQRYLSSNYRQTKQKTNTQLTYTNDFLEKILIDAKQVGSSDIHFEPYEKRCRVRFRLDGKLIEQFTIPQEEYPMIVNKVKIKADLDIAEKRLPQDGRISINTNGNEFDIRVSTLPILHGEKLVLRILSKDSTIIDLERVGLSEKELLNYREGLKQPSGIILISGPTGSGKTTTLYATLKELNTEGDNILTLEDPIEYTLDGINQVQLKENIGLDFVRTLKTFLRQDPDTIMIGEIRDADTANVAIRAAQTGHLVLSTIHTNSSWGTISRLIDMGVPSFLIASTLNMSIAQRLVRKLCNDCKKESVIDTKLFPQGFEIPKDLKSHYAAVGCNTCHHTGYHGRKAIYEILPISKDLMVPIRDNHLEIDNQLKEKGIMTLKDNALNLIKSGLTSIEEVYSLLTN
ncbi:type II/IV secretion system protein [Maribacter algarum]|uniref:Type II/IV secretion system protein n=1 Tax=Maribacter algarum (ex Zhang et al. 2020) TaxID=2578118 RepID=A0A5S3PE45_9FLAO|nr:GspE/PulE family protein [Maribacter algarum]TMM52147.1 type II/IV secretion system protein [Maribacter algarum]